MRALTRRRFWIAVRYRLGVLSMCLAYLLTALEIPLPVFVHKKSSQPFPCQDHPCGCQTAEQCWSHCCCFTAEERWAWARAHNVEPPTYAEKPVNQGWNSVKLRDRDGGATTKSCCAHQPAAPRTASLSGGAGRQMTMIAALRCQGYSTLWTSAGAVLPVSPLPAWAPDSIPPVRVCLPSLRPDMVPFTPPDPPPRLPLV